MKRRKLEEKIFKALMLGSLALVLLILSGIVLVVVVRGASSLSLAMLTQTPKGGFYLGKEGGILNAIIGSFCLAIGATVLSALVSLPIAFALQKEYTGSRLANLTRLSLDVLWGIPSIVYGAFGFVIMMYLGLRASLLGGIIALSFLMLPIMTRSMEEVIRMIPIELKETAYALGITRLETTLAVVLRQALPGMITGVMLAFGRGIGDAASILFTAGYTDYIPRSLFDPVASLPLAVFFQIGTPIPEVQQRAYASALILLIIVLVVSLIARLLNARYSKNIIK
ncbi:MAG: phosphate ABC transporter permease PstA [candidate division KSB1 bacterium]|nr:phosphate ABC transporter permease PstA [candidate division KSB1 bacterium]MDZ7336211.1 phosphate ABC transporter permease PstA [candidate division KSB1 bacterium]MDZ7358956.1 phosphate ABC transporter permease PstA [candidate division KSB1 bacterium]MDZ7376362.1 phosphate ABC transporter permease PstA [candidate division KSB1 bacterium]MDZ7402345.1 phosphate ABC transporter permease PstA [candidate division KSB1 bacterium]